MPDYVGLIPADELDGITLCWAFQSGGAKGETLHAWLRGNGDTDAIRALALAGYMVLSDFLLQPGEPMRRITDEALAVVRDLHALAEYTGQPHPEQRQRLVAVVNGGPEEPQFLSPMQITGEWHAEAEESWARLAVTRDALTTPVVPS